MARSAASIPFLKMSACLFLYLALSLVTVSSQTLDIPESIAVEQSNVVYFSQLPLPPPGGPLFWQSFDVPPPSNQMKSFFPSPKYSNCHWAGDAYGDSLTVSSGAYILDGSCYLQFASLPYYPLLSIRLQFALISVPALNSTLLSLGSKDQKDNIEINIAGTNESNHGSSAQEASLQLRVWNNGYSCTSLRRGCVLDLPGFVQVGVWNDLVINFDQNGYATIYNNGSFVAHDYLMTRLGVSSYSMVLAGSSIASATTDLSESSSGCPLRCPAISQWPKYYNTPYCDCDCSPDSNDGFDLDNSYCLRVDAAPFALRGVQFFNTTFTNFNISKLFPVPQDSDGVNDNFNFNSAVKGFASLEQRPPQLKQLGFTTPPASYAFNFRNVDIFAGWTQETYYTLTAQPVGSVVGPVRDALGTVTFDGVIISGANSFIQLQQMMIGGNFSVQAMFQFDSVAVQSLAPFVLFSASVPSNTPTVLVDTVLLYATPVAPVLPDTVSAAVTIAVQRGRNLWNNFTAITHSPTYRSIFNIIATVSSAGIGRLYNDGILFGITNQMTVPYPRVRTLNTAGGMNSTFASQLGLTRSTTGTLALSVVSHWPYILSASEIASSRVLNSSIAIDMSWEAQTFTFNDLPTFEDDRNPSRGSAQWQLAVPAVPVTLNNTAINLTAWQLTNGGYLNLGSTRFGGECTFTATFQIVTLAAGVTLFEFSNGAVFPGADVFSIGTGAMNSVTTDLVINVIRSGMTFPAGPIVVPAVLHANLAHELVITFQFNTISVYLDGLLLAFQKPMWAPVLVQRPYGLVGRSFNATLSPTYPANVAQMIVFSLAFIPKPSSQQDVLALSPLYMPPYWYSFLSNSSIPGANSDKSALAALQTNGGGPLSLYPILHNCVVSANPFLQSTVKKNIDGTIASVATPQQVPTPGVFLDNRGPALFDSELHTTQKKIDNVKAEMVQLGIVNITAVQLAIRACNDHLAFLNQTISGVVTQLANATGNATEVNILNHKMDSLNAEYELWSGYLSGNQSQLTNSGRLSNFLTNIIEPFFNLVLDGFQKDLSDTQSQRAVAIAHQSYIEMGPIFIGGPFTVRSKFVLKTDVPAGTWLPIWETSNGPMNDSILLSVAGPLNAMVLQLTIYRGSLSHSVVSAPMNGSFYWLDTIITVDQSANVNFYLWGTWVSTANIQWTPNLVLRNISTIGYSTTLQAYSVNTGIGVVTWSSGVMDGTSMSNIYANDHPPFIVKTLDSDWIVHNPMAYGPSTAYPQAASMGQCSHYAWMLDIPEEDFFAFASEGWNDHFRWFGWNQYSYSWVETLSQAENITIHNAIKYDANAPARQVLSPYVLTQSNQCFSPADYLPLRYTLRDNLFDDSQYVSTSSQIMAIQYFEPQILLLPSVNQPNNVLNVEQFGFIIDLKNPGIWEDFINITIPNLNATLRLFDEGILQFPMNQMLEFNFNGREHCYLNGNPFDDKGADAGCSRLTGLATLRAECIGLPCSERKNTNCQCMPQSYNLLIVPPTFRFQYFDPASGKTELRPTMKEISGGIDIPFGQLSAGDRFQNAFFNPLANQPMNFTLGVGELITQVNTICNYRFEFVTSIGRSLIIGSHPVIDQIDSCQQSAFYSTFSGVDGEIFNFGSQSSSNVMSTPVANMQKAGMNFDPLNPVFDPLKQSWGQPGYALQYMEGSKDAAYAYRFHWISQPTSYRIFNLVFDLSATDALFGTKPTTAITVDLYNSSPIQQSITAIRGMTTSSEYSFTNEHSEEHNWQVGTTTSISLGFNSNTGIEAGGEAFKFSQSFGFSFNSEISNSMTVGGSTSVSTSYGTTTVNSNEVQQWLQAEVPAYSKISATMVAFTSRRDIPYTADVEITYATGAVQHLITHGVFTSVTTDSIIVQYSDAVAIGNGKADASSSSSNARNVGMERTA